ncbi:amidohydrolase [Paracoccus aurantiacus]|uniref:Amidohydrolase n=1 Tax=Paracoccus aurantiacus TaxID=2599412 RepID=A0A5C6S7N1_9RHOB|nr:amidohydrolase [Paracoccus aurantiacus]TXB70517.1 amidohydrolase [Paracoccus aurantiacus]
MLTNADIAELTALRREIHQNPELSGVEGATAARMAGLMRDLGADEVLTGIGGTGVVAAFRGAAPGPSVMFRAELDALPIVEAQGLPHRSTTEGIAHLCGHDGHMIGLVGLARMLSRQRPARGTVWLLFQPAEENGAGSAAMLADPRLPAFDYGFAIHNYPGVAMGHALLAPGAVNCASVGMRVRLAGATSHASEPEKARTPTLAIAAILPALLALAQGGVSDPGFRLVTITHLNMGEPAFGITPGTAEIWVTLRSQRDEAMADLRDEAMRIVTDAAAIHDLNADFDWQDEFAASINHPEATKIMTRAAEATGIDLSPDGLPMRASEDFGRFAARAKTAMILLGAGKDNPPLHAENYDYPDDLIAPSVRLFERIARELTG